MLTLILASHSIEADAPDLLFTEYATIGEVLEAVAEWDILTDGELADLDNRLCVARPGIVVPIEYRIGDFGVSAGCVVRS